MTYSHDRLTCRPNRRIHEPRAQVNADLPHVTCRHRESWVEVQQCGLRTGPLAERDLQICRIMRGHDADHNPRMPIRSSLPHTKGSKCDVNMGVALTAAHRQAHRQNG